MTARGVSVVVPTVGRAELARAVRSARTQFGGFDLEIVVSVDGPEGSLELPRPALRDVDTVVWTGGDRGGSAARNLGVAAATRPWVAFLDDDDEWLPTKLMEQFRLVPDDTSTRVLLSSRHVHVDPRTGAESAPVPGRLKRTDETIPRYLFRRRRPSAGRASMYTSTLVCSRDLVDEVPWDESLRRHQDWDWLLRVSRLPAVTVRQAPAALVRIQTGSTGSISAGSDWQSSLTWARGVVRPFGRQTYADFLAAQTLRYAVGARSRTGIRRTCLELLRNRRLPGLGPLVIAAGGLLSRSTVEKLLTGAS
jgi:glycosyltransferase involved in cell wall biosynthesis